MDSDWRNWGSAGQFLGNGPIGFRSPDALPEWRAAEGFRLLTDRWMFRLAMLYPPPSSVFHPFLACAAL
jgi:hypothetical protein